MLKLDSTLMTLVIAGAVALTTGWIAGGTLPGGLATGAALAADQPAPRSPWAASATGRVEPRDGETRISAQVAGPIVAVAVKANDKVMAGDLLVRLDDADLSDKLASAKAEAEVREREREEEPATKGLGLDRRKAQDAVALAERKAFSALGALDVASAALRDGAGKPEAVNNARTALTNARADLADERENLSKVEATEDLPLMTRLETALEQSRADISLIETAIERTRIRAPYDGTALNVFARLGELAVPSPESPLLNFGDLSSLRVRAELEEREVVKVHVGQAVVVRVDAYPDRDFPGTISSIAASLGAPRIVARGPRRPNDVEVLEVMVALDGQPPLLTGMRVDVFFRADSDKQSAVAAPVQ
ncbi:MAG: HlyD family secretion protein [Hyphomicrobium sp.]